MKPTILKQLPLVAFLLLAFTFCAYGQKQPVSKSPNTGKLKQEVDAKRISASDRQAIMNLFKGVDPSKYKLQFYNGESKKPSTTGNLRYSMNDLNQVKRVTNPIDAVGWIVFVVEGDDVIYVLAVGSDKLKSVLGADKVNRLNNIMAKYK